MNSDSSVRPKQRSSAHYQREYRRRLREQGLVKREVWIRPENARLLSRLEKQLREEGGSIKGGGVDYKSNIGVNVMTDNLTVWNTEKLYSALKKTELFVSETGSIELLEGVEPTIHVIMRAYGDLPIFLTVSGEQIIVESVLWSTSEINDVAGFNDAILRTHKYFSLSTISLDVMSDGSSYYHMFGALSSTSILPNIVFEIEVLASNVIQATAAYSGFLKTPIEAC